MLPCTPENPPREAPLLTPDGGVKVCHPGRLDWTGARFAAPFEFADAPKPRPEFPALANECEGFMFAREAPVKKCCELEGML